MYSNNLQSPSLKCSTPEQGSCSVSLLRHGCVGPLADSATPTRATASRPSIHGSGRRFRVGAGSSICVLERPHPRINLTFTWKRPLVPQQPMSAPAPQRAILVADLGRILWQDRIGNGGGFGSENGNRWRFWSGIRDLPAQPVIETIPSAALKPVDQPSSRRKTASWSLVLAKRPSGSSSARRWCRRSALRTKPGICNA